MQRHFLSRALAAPLFGKTEPLLQFRKKVSRGTIPWNNYELGPLVLEEISFKDISYLELWLPFCSAERNRLCKFGRGYYEEQFCENILNLDQWFRRRCFLKIFLIWSSGDPFVQQSGTICAILVEGIKRNNNFEFGPLVQEMSFKDISYLDLWLHFCSAERNRLCDFGRGYYEEQFSEIIF